MASSSLLHLTKSTVKKWIEALFAAGTVACPAKHSGFQYK
jgi:hypothetical protein